MKVLGCTPAFWSSETFASKIAEVTGTKTTAKVKTIENSLLVETEHKTQTLYKGDVSTFTVNLEFPKKGIHGKCSGSYRHWKTEDKPTCTHAVMMVCDSFTDKTGKEVPDTVVDLKRHHWKFETTVDQSELPDPSMANRFVTSLKRKLTLFPEPEAKPSAPTRAPASVSQSAK